MSGQIIKSTLLGKKVLSLELKNPMKNNALSLKMLDEIIALLTHKNLPTKYNILVFRGFQDGVFSAGADLSEVKALKKEKNLNIYHSKLNKLLKILNKLPLVKVSIIKSYCIGAGFILAMNTDICLANTNCLFSIPASKLNIRLPSNQLDFLMKKFPGNLLLKEAILTGRKFSSSEAYNFNIINKVLDEKNFKNNYLAFLENFILINDRVLRQYHKKLFNIL